MSAPVLPSYRVDGSAGAETLVLVGSIGADVDLWRHQYRSLSGARLRVVSVNLRGHGGAAAPPGPYRIVDLAYDVLAVVDTIIAPGAVFHLAGVSCGAVVAESIAAYQPERVCSLTLLSPLPHHDGMQRRWAGHVNAVRRGGTVAIAEKLVARWYTPGFAAEHVSAVISSRASVVSNSDDGYIRCSQALADPAGWPERAHIVAPTLVVAGAGDHITPPAHVAVVAAAIPGATLHVVAPAAHMVQIEQAELVTELIREHIYTATGCGHDQLRTP